MDRDRSPQTSQVLFSNKIHKKKMTALMFGQAETGPTSAHFALVERNTPDIYLQKTKYI